MTNSSIASSAIVMDKGPEVSLVDNTHVVYKEGWMIISKPLQQCTVLRYHHYLPHQGHTCLEETMNATMYWKSMRTTIQSITKLCKSCHVNMKCELKYRHLPTTIPWRALCFDLIGPYTFKGKDGTVINFIALTTIDPSSSCFVMVELP